MTVALAHSIGQTELENAYATLFGLGMRGVAGMGCSGDDEDGDKLLRPLKNRDIYRSARPIVPRP